MVFPGHSAAVVLLSYDLCLVIGELGFHSRAGTGWVSLAYRLGRIQPNQGTLRTQLWTQPKLLYGDPSQSGWSSTLSGDTAASVPGLVTCGRVAGMWPCSASPRATAQLFALAPVVSAAVLSAICLGKEGNSGDTQPWPC